MKIMTQNFKMATNGLYCVTNSPNTHTRMQFSSGNNGDSFKCLNCVDSIINNYIYSFTK